jgi:hypothetical protein
MNRITTFLSFIFALHFQLISQTSLTSQQVNYPLCGTEILTQQQVENDPAYEQELQRFFEVAVPFLSGRDRSAVEPLISITVVVHVIHSGEPVGQGSNLSDAQVMAQVAVLNEDFSALNPQFYNTPAQWAGVAGTPNIQFCLATKDPAGNPTNGITRHNIPVTGTTFSNSNINTEIKPQTNWNPSKYFNVYVLAIPGTTAAGGVVGFSNYPTISSVGNTADGVVIDYRWFGAPGFGVSGYRGLTHETGHYLGVRHPFHGNSCSTDDGITDTPEIEKATREYADLDCSGGNYAAPPVSCGNEHLYVNYMDYVNENCYTSFTNGQIALMRAVLDGTSSGFGYGSRLSLVQNAPLQCNLPANDAGITRVVSPENVSCTNLPVEPQVTLRNFGTQDLTSSLIIYRINNGAPDTLLWQGSLSPGENENVTLGDYLPPDGVYTFTAYTSRPNGVADQRTTNDTLTWGLLTYYGYETPLFENFENETALPTSDGVFAYDVDGDGLKWQLKQNVSGFGQGQVSAMFDNYISTPNSPAGTLDALITRHYDFSDLPNPTLSFDVAYAPKSNANDTLMLLVATDCSQNFNLLAYLNGGITLATAPATNNPFTPSPTQWRTETVNLSTFGGMEDVTFAFVNVSGGGNRLYIDNIRLGAPCSSLHAAVVSVQHESFYQAKNGSLSVSVPSGNPPYTYLWSNGATTQSIFNLAPGTYSVTITDLFACSVVKQATVQAFNCGNFFVSTQVANVVCYGGSTGSATAIAVNGTPPYNYLWNTGANTQTIESLAAGAYSVTVTDSNQCPTANTAVVSEPTLLSVNVQATAQSAVGVHDGTATAIASGGTGGYQFLWSNGNVGQTIGNLAPGTYSVTVTDANGCMASATANVPSVNCNNFVAQIQASDLTCFGMNNGTATVSASSNALPIGFNWSTGANSQSVENLAAGTYWVTVSDNAGCTAELVTAITQPPLLTLTVSVTHETIVGAKNGTASASAVGGVSLPGGGYSFLWNNGATSAAISDLAPGSYTVTVTDANDCTASKTVEVEGVNCSISIQLNTTAASCTTVADGSAEVTTVMGGNAPYNYKWSNGSTNFFVQNLLPGTYTVTVSDAAGCSVVESLTIADNDFSPPTAVAKNITVVLDENGIAMITPNEVDGGSFDNCSQVNLELDISTFNCGDVGTKQVTLKVTDANGNSSTAKATITIENSLNIAYQVHEPSCHGFSDGYIDLDITGGALPFSAVWSHGSGAGNLKAGQYGVTVTDGNGCSKSSTILVGEPDPIVVSVANTIPATNSQPNGVISISIAGGTAPYTLAWMQNGVVQLNFDPLHAEPGTYQAKVTDSQGCIEISGFVTVENILGTGATSLDNSMRLFPNPSDGLIYLKFDQNISSEILVTVVDVDGRELKRVANIPTASSTLSVDLSALSCGVYWLKIWMGNDFAVRKIVKL